MYDPIIDWQLSSTPGIKDAPLAREMDVDDYLDEDFIARNVRGFIAGVEILDEPKPDWSELVRMRIETTHPAWVAHLVEGMSWATTSYGSGDGEEWDGSTRRPGDHVDEFSDDPMAGMLSSPRRDEAMK